MLKKLRTKAEAAMILPNRMHSKSSGEPAYVFLSYAAMFILLLGNTSSAISQTEFPGSLDTVSITDTQGTNSAPIAVFTYTQIGNILTFDASGSSDSDGNITDYRWNFSDGNTAKGQKTTLTVAEGTQLTTTLTVEDNNGGISLTQKSITTSTGDLITDNFSTNTSDDYDILSGSISIVNNTLMGKNYAKTRIIHKQDIGKGDLWAQADITYSGESDGGAIITKYNPSNGKLYLTYFSAGRLYVANSNGLSFVYAGNYQKGIYTVRVEHTAGLIKVFVEGNNVLTKQDSAPVDGTFVGIQISRVSKNSDISVDNFSASAN